MDLWDTVGLCVETSVGRQRREELVRDGEETTVGRFGEGNEGGEVAGWGGEEEDVVGCVGAV